MRGEVYSLVNTFCTSGIDIFTNKHDEGVAKVDLLNRCEQILTMLTKTY